MKTLEFYNICRGMTQINNKSNKPPIIRITDNTTNPASCLSILAALLVFKHIHTCIEED